MKIFAISDLHLSFGSNKPMDIFGDHWKDHPQRIEEAWTRLVSEKDYVLMGGDLSWGMNLEEVAPDLAFVDKLPGKKLMIKGNHAHWWNTKKKVKAALPDSISILQNDSFVLPDGTAIVGTRGWNPPGRSEGKPYSDQDRKVYERELLRFGLSLQDLTKKKYRRIWSLIHYPPVYSFGLETGFVPMMKEAGVELCVYGHLHGRDHAAGFVGEKDGIQYVMASADYVDFSPVLLDE
jgi:predicted phosphohydrolase